MIMGYSMLTTKQGGKGNCKGLDFRTFGDGEGEEAGDRRVWTKWCGRVVDKGKDMGAGRKPNGARWEGCRSGYEVGWK